ncbi:MAG: helix-turn-helix transcriptional regulator [Terracoccus sp.]
MGPATPPKRPATETTETTDNMADGGSNSAVSTFHDTRAARAIRRIELGDFLRTRRAAITPTDVGLTVTGHRKTPGLRREEVAQLAGVGLSWYTWLEQARDITPSVQVLESIGRALRLDQTQTDHVFHLAGLDIPSSALAGSADELDFDEIVRSLLPHAAYVLNPRFDVVAFNVNAELILGGLAQREPGKRNLLRWLFDDEGPYQGLDESIASVAYANLRDFRVEYARHVGDPWYERLVAELSAQSAQFRTWWDEHAVRVIVPTHHRIPHRQYGSLQILFIETRPVHQPEYRVRILTAGDERTRSIFAQHHNPHG